MPKIKEDALFLIDGSYILYRSYYGLRSLQTSKGIPTQAIYGFCRTIQKMIDEFDPKNMILIWDSKGKTFRSDIYKEYKATRQVPPSDLFEQKEAIMEFADLIGLHQLSKTGYEADDLIGSAVNDFKKNQIVIVGPDKDLYQLLADDTVLIFDSFKDELVDAKTFKEQKGFEVEKIPFYYSLLGDTSDNIPGVKGIGKKTAEDLVKEFDSLEDLYKNLDKVKKERTKKLLEEGRENAFLSFKLFSLKNYKLNLTPKDFEFNKDDWANAASFFREYEFSSMFRDLQKRYGLTETVQQNVVQARQLSLFETEYGATEKEVKITIKKAKEWNCYIVETQDGLNKVIDLAKKKKEFAFDTEATGFRPLRDELVGFSFSFDKKNGYYIPLTHTQNGADRQLKREDVLEQLKEVMHDEKIEKILHNTKFDQLLLLQYGVDIKNVTFDTILAANLLRKQDSDKINLKVLSVRYLDEPMESFKDVLGKHKDFTEVPIQRASEYAAHDALQTFKLKSVLEKDLNKYKKIKKIFKDLEMPISQILLKMEMAGISLDPDRLKEVGKEIEKDLNSIEKKIYAAIDHKEKFKDINLNSPKQIEALLFDELKLPSLKKSGKGKRSTDQEVLAELSKMDPIPGMIMKYREYYKLKSTYADPLVKQINSKTKRIHSSFNQIMVATGRISSSDPNLQNIPVSSDYGMKIRSAFVAPRGRRFLSADYSQIDLRVLAELSGDKSLKKAFLNNQDIHSQAASQIFDIPLDKVSNKERQLGKRINFGIAYGLTPFGLAKDLGIKPGEAKEYIDKYFKEYSGVVKWINKTIDFAESNGYVETWMGRRRYIPNIKERNRTLYEAAKRIAINTPVQGTSAEILKLAMIEIDKKLTESKIDAFMVLQIHDEVIVEYPMDETDRVEKIVKKCMENVVKWSVPLSVSVRTGKNWEQISK